MGVIISVTSTFASLKHCPENVLQASHIFFNLINKLKAYHHLKCTMQKITDQSFGEMNAVKSARRTMKEWMPDIRERFVEQSLTRSSMVVKETLVEDDDTHSVFCECRGGCGRASFLFNDTIQHCTICDTVVCSIRCWSDEENRCKVCSGDMVDEVKKTMEARNNRDRGNQYGKVLWTDDEDRDVREGYRKNHSSKVSRVASEWNNHTGISDRALAKVIAASLPGKKPQDVRNRWKILKNQIEWEDEEDGDEDDGDEEDGNEEEDEGLCKICGEGGGDLVVCDGGKHDAGCECEFHLNCIDRKTYPNGESINELNALS